MAHKKISEQRAEALKSANDLVDGAKAGGRDLTADELTEVQGYVDAVKAFDVQLEAAAKSADVTAALLGLAPSGHKAGDEKSDDAPRTLGEHFVKHAGSRLAETKGVRGASTTAPEFKAATDTQVVGSVFGATLTTIDRTVVQAPRTRLTIADLLGKGTISGNAISYFIEAGIEGAFTTVAEGGAKPQLHIVDPTLATDALKKIAGFIKLSDEMIEDLDFIVSEINGRLVYELARFEENQVLSGNGVGTNVLGLLNRSGVQSLARGTVASGDSAADTLFRAITATSTGSGLDADGIVINPLDYQTLRLAKDGNGQYYGGGFFAGQYGSGTMQDQPPVWGLRTVVTTAVPVGTAVVGAFSQSATLYRKGGVRVESTNSHDKDFTNNLVTVRAEERVALAMRKPAGLVKVTLTPAP